MCSNNRVAVVNKVCKPELSEPGSPELFGPGVRTYLKLLWMFPFALAATVVWELVSAPNGNTPYLMPMLAIAGMNLLVLVGLLANRRIVRNGLRIRSGGALHLIGARYGGFLVVLMGLCFVGAWYADLWWRVSEYVSPDFGSSGRRGGTMFFLFAGIGCIVVGIVKPFLPTGVKICEEGLKVRKGVIEHRIPWHQLEGVALRLRGRVLALELAFVSGPIYCVMPVHLGSNPYYVAELILYYLRHPGRRELLRDPDAAIREVMEVEGPESATGPGGRRSRTAGTTDQP